MIRDAERLGVPWPPPGCDGPGQKIQHRKKCGFAHFLVLFLELAETPRFVQINVLPFGL